MARRQSPHGPPVMLLFVRPDIWPGHCHQGCSQQHRYEPSDRDFGGAEVCSACRRFHHCGSSEPNDCFHLSNCGDDAPLPIPHAHHSFSSSASHREILSFPRDHERPRRCALVLTGIRPIEINKVAIASSKRSRLSATLGRWQDRCQNRLHMRIFRPPWSG